MSDKKKKRKTGTISEDDTISLLQRYGATTILTLLQEIAQCADVKIDWERIVKRSSTGISNPREYQLLWRHLAYCEPLLENIDGTEPMDDDSDLEFEVESVPAVSAEVASQAAAVAKGLMPVSFSSESGPRNDSVVKVHSALVTSNGPTSNTTLSDKEHAASPASRRNTAPVSLHKQMISTGPPAEGFEGNEIIGVGSANKKKNAEGFEGNETAGAGPTSKKKRKLWTEEEDTELQAAVQKFGEGNWVSILKGDFKLDRTASQLSQRWAILKKRLANSNIRRSSKSISLAQAEALDAARFALNSALKMPPSRSFSVTNAGAVHSTTPSIISTSSTVSGTLCRSTPPQNPKLLQEAPSQVALENGILIPSNKPQSIPKTPRTATSSLIKAAAFAAGGRIVAHSAAASLFQAVQQSKNVVHIRAGGSQLTSIANKGRQQSSIHHAQPIMMRPPPSPGIPLKMLDGSKVPSNIKPGNSNFEGRSSATGAQQVSCSPGNAEKVSGKETSASNAVEGLPTGVTDGGDKTELDGVLNQDQKKSSEVGEKDTTVELDGILNQDQDSSEVGEGEKDTRVELDGILNQDQKKSSEVGEKDARAGKDVDITVDNSNL